MVEHPCNCENELCRARTHTVRGRFSQCPNPGKYAVQWVGAICESCAHSMPIRFGREPTIAEIAAYGLKALDELEISR